MKIKKKDFDGTDKTITYVRIRLETGSHEYRRFLEATDAKSRLVLDRNVMPDNDLVLYIR